MGGSGSDQADKADKAPTRPWIKIGIRLAIYLPLLAYFGWRAGTGFFDARDAADGAFRQSVNQWLTHPPRTINVGGREVPILEVTEAEAAALGYLPPPSAPAQTDGATN